MRIVLLTKTNEDAVTESLCSQVVPQYTESDNRRLPAHRSCVNQGITDPDPVFETRQKTGCCILVGTLERLHLIRSLTTERSICSIAHDTCGQNRTFILTILRVLFHNGRWLGSALVAPRVVELRHFHEKS